MAKRLQTRKRKGWTLFAKVRGRWQRWGCLLWATRQRAESHYSRTLQGLPEGYVSLAQKLGIREVG